MYLPEYRATTWGLCKAGYTVIMACRSVLAAEEEQRKIEAARTSGRPIVLGPLDLASSDSIRAFVDIFQRAYNRLDVLVNNAGCNFIKEWRTQQGVPGLVQVSPHHTAIECIPLHGTWSASHPPHHWDWPLKVVPCHSASCGGHGDTQPELTPDHPSYTR